MKQEILSVLNMLKKLEKNLSPDCMIKFQNPKYLFCLVGSFNQVMGKIYEKIDKAIFNALDDGGKILGICRYASFFL